MKELVKLGVVALIGVLTLVFVSCSNDDSGTARLEVRMTDAPGDFEEVNIDIQDVQVNRGDDDSGWQSLTIESGVYNILELTNGLDTLLGAITLPSGPVQQIRLVLGDNNSVVIDGETYPLSTPSAQQSGLKLNLNVTLTEGITYTLLLDFDAAASVVARGNDTYSLKPVIRVISEATSGAIAGSVTPLDATPAVFVINGIDTVASTFADSTGMFMVKGLDAGTYTVSLVPSSAYTTVNKTDVSVTVGNVTNLGIIEF
jgi:hypothetical protein